MRQERERVMFAVDSVRLDESYYDLVPSAEASKSSSLIATEKVQSVAEFGKSPGSFFGLREASRINFFLSLFTST